MWVHLSLGSNIGDREEYLASALKLIGLFPETEVLAVSDIYLCDPVGENVEGYFYNIVACVETHMQLYELHKGLMEIEHILGKAKTPDIENRTIDIDIIFAGDFKGRYNDLKIPHPEYSKRDFVLMPLQELEETLNEKQREAVDKHLVRERADDAPVCLRYKKMVY